MLLYQILVFTIHEKLPSGSYSSSGEKTDKTSIRIYVNKIENRITFK